MVRQRVIVTRTLNLTRPLNMFSTVTLTLITRTLTLTFPTISKAYFEYELTTFKVPFTENIIFAHFLSDSTMECKMIYNDPSKVRVRVRSIICRRRIRKEFLISFLGLGLEIGVRNRVI
jgi:hypothetical protein